MESEAKVTKRERDIRVSKMAELEPWIERERDYKEGLLIRVVIQ